MLKMRKYLLPTFQSTTQIVKKKNRKNPSYHFDGSKQRRMALYCSKILPALLRGARQNTTVTFIVWIFFSLLQQKSDKVPFIIYADLESLIEKTDGCKNSPENSSTTKVGQHIPSGFSMFTISSFKSIEYKYDVYGGKDCMKKVCESLREHAVEMVKFKNKKIKLLTNE